MPPPTASSTSTTTLVVSMNLPTHNPTSSLRLPKLSSLSPTRKPTPIPSIIPLPTFLPATSCPPGPGDTSTSLHDSPRSISTCACHLRSANKLSLRSAKVRSTTTLSLTACKHSLENGTAPRPLQNHRLPKDPLPPLPPLPPP